MKFTSIFLGAAVLALAYSQLYAAEIIDFNTRVKPLLEGYGVSCHNPEKARDNGDLDLSTMKGAEDTLTAGQPEKSSMYKRLLLPAADKKLMPPTNKGGRSKRTRSKLSSNGLQAARNGPKASY